MKRCVILLFLVITLLFTSSTISRAEEPNYEKVHDALIYALYPYIKDEIIKYYGYNKQYELYNTKIININKEYSGGYKVKIQVPTFEHAHNPPYGIETITFLIKLSSIETIEFQHQGDEKEKQITKFYDEALNDIIRSFKLDLKGYIKYTYPQLLYLEYTNKSYKSLVEIVHDTVKNIINKEYEPPYKNVIEPVTYIKEDEAYILFKKADGLNVIYKVKKIKDIWKVIEHHELQGKKMKNELIWYM